MDILAINPGSTSTKIAVFRDEKPIFEKTLRHTMEELAGFASIADQYAFRKGVLEAALAEAGIEPASLDAVVGRGGLLKPIPGGTYRVGEAMLADLRRSPLGEHASNLGGLIAYELASGAGIPAFIVDPVVVDELEPISRFSGHPEIPRRSIFHALNQKAIARRHCAEVGTGYFEATLIVAHLGGGISVGLHRNGRVVDVNNALDGEGPFSPERSGGLPSGDLARLCYGGKSHAEIKRMITGNGGFAAYRNSTDMIDLERQAETDAELRLLFDAMAYQVAKEIAGVSVAAAGQVQAILRTGGLAHSKIVTGAIAERVRFVAPVHVYPGEDELLALVQGALRVLRGEEEAREYGPSS
ncbi:MAG: butyrate kinase [Treponema sp.]|nr:butyrate kinase [Treponema sp.]